MKRPLSIRTQVLGLCAALLLIAAAGQLLFGACFARAYFLHQKKAEIQTFFGYIRDNYRGDDPRQLYELLREGEDVQNIRVAIYDERGKLIYTSRPAREGFGVEPQLPAMHGVIPFSETPQAQELPGSAGEDAQLGLTGQFEFQGQTRYVLLWVMVASIESSISAFNHVSVWIVGGVLAAGTLAGALLARRITTPIRRIQQVSRQVADLDFTARADEGCSIRELSELAGSVNRMADHLSAAVEELRVANAALQRDVDRQKQLEQMRREFVANVSHEMKTPLCLLQMYAENLKNDLPGIDRGEYCDIIVDEVQRLSQMVGSMLELSSIENGLSAMEPVPLELGTLCRDTLIRMAPMLAGCRMEGPGEGDFPVRGDPKYLEMALGNYLSNAAAHTPPGGLVRVSLERREGWAAVTVSNQGQPIPEDRLERVWDSFYKVDEARTRSEQVHAGLGLAIVKNIIQYHGGSCRVENLPDGVAFSFLLPLEEGPGETQ